ncbi:unnamed protein product [Ixodes persulcatus]
MSGADSGIETGSESNGSTTMSVESPPRVNNDPPDPPRHPSEEDSGAPAAPEAPAGLCFQNVVPLPDQNGYSCLQEGGLLYDEPSRHPCVGKMRHAHRKGVRWWPNSCLKGRDVLSERKLRIGAITNKVDLVHRLLMNGVNPRAADERRRTALHFAACKGNLLIVKMLLEYGANPNQKDIVGNTALHLAVCTSHTEVITLLLKAGTDVNSLDNSGRTPLHLAQSKLRLLQMDLAKSSESLKQEVMQVIEMMQVYLQRSGKSAECDLLGTFSTRIRLHQTRQEVDNDVQDLLSSLAHLSLHKT